jgi:hypothetical protein
MSVICAGEAPLAGAVHLRGKVPRVARLLRRSNLKLLSD